MGSIESRQSLPPALCVSVALIASAMILVEIVLTRIFSALFFYHYSFFAISLAMSGLSFGGILASRWHCKTLAPDKFQSLLSSLAILFSSFGLVALLVLLSLPSVPASSTPSYFYVAVTALVFLPGLTCAGAYLACAFARRRDWIGSLYASDLLGASMTCMISIFLMRLFQGPASLLIPIVLAAAASFLVSRSNRYRSGFAVVLMLLPGALAAWNVLNDGKSIRLKTDPQPVFEQWNEHSRITAYPRSRDSGLHVLIDKSASTDFYPIPDRNEGEPIAPNRDWGSDTTTLASRIGRPLRKTAVLGVGGGRDVLALFAHGAQEVDGFELNDILIRLHSRPSSPARGDLSTWPDFNLIHSEARVGVSHSDKKYDLIQASMTDTWAATAGGGFVLAENGLYTLEGWSTFLGALSDSGILTMSRWYIPFAPAEAQRLVSLAVESLIQRGIESPRAHIVLVADVQPGPTPMQSTRDAGFATILVSIRPFSSEEIARVAKICAEQGWVVIASPESLPIDPEIDRLLDPGRRAEAIAQSIFDLSVPTDARPYFFLQVRLRDVFALGNRDLGPLLGITFAALRVLAFLASISALFALAVWIFAFLSRPSRNSGPHAVRLYRTMSGYFLCIGVGYIFIQIGLLQRLIVLLGHPTHALSVVLFSMLLGTAGGSASCGALFSPRSFRFAWFSIPAVLWVLILVLAPATQWILAIHAPIGRSLACATIVAIPAFVLGFGFPLGIKLVYGAGESAVQMMWAINGAASIAGSALGAIIGIAFGNHVVLWAGLLFYLLAILMGIRALKVTTYSSFETL